LGPAEFSFGNWNLNTDTICSSQENKNGRENGRPGATLELRNNGDRLLQKINVSQSRGRSSALNVALDRPKASDARPFC
jgi:hypothetical protein